MSNTGQQYTLGLTIKQFGISQGRCRTLKEFDVFRVSDLVKLSAKTLYRLPLFGLSSVAVIDKKLSNMGLKLGMTDEEISRIIRYDNKQEKKETAPTVKETVPPYKEPNPERFQDFKQLTSTEKLGIALGFLQEILNDLLGPHDTDKL